ncbi:hypothetical protein LCGC14_2897540 [marine sediment metagenome]|uniref:Uncharacterized protein n=1 Tax=marine sediment metagenome TaxID=412755 RepID=A0A0F8XVT1_9ZZZZ
MESKLCYIQDTCPLYETGDNKPANNDVRNKVLCHKSLEGCDMEIRLRLHHGEIIACNIEEVKRKKEQIKRKVKY